MNPFKRMVQGRNGFDQLTAGVLIAGLLFLFAAAIFKMPPIAMLYLLCVIYAVFRIFSPDTNKRRSENWKFLAVLRRIASWWKLRIRMIREFKTHRYLKCSDCKTYLRVPKGKGKISVTCRKCGKSFIAKV